MKPGRSHLLFLGVFLLISVAIAGIAYFGDPRSILDLFWSRPFLRLVKIASAIAIFLGILRWFGRNLPQKILKWVCGLIFLPVLILPVFSCYFKVPYVFCRACPNRCPWGMLRSVAFSSFILLNFSQKFWCSSLCPFGTVQESQAGLSKKYLKLPAWAAVSAFVALIAVAGMYLLTFLHPRWTEWFDLGRYAWVGGTALAFLGIFAGSFWVPKFFCRYFCPVGTIAEFTSKLKPEK